MKQLKKIAPWLLALITFSLLMAGCTSRGGDGGNPGNTTPTANAQSVTTDENTAKDITLTGSDPDGDTLTFTVTGNPAHGTLSGTAKNIVGSNVVLLIIIT